MSNPVELRPKNCTDTLKKAGVVAAKGLAVAAAVTAVSGAIFLLIAASVNPITTPGFLGYMAMAIEKAHPVLGLISLKTFVNVGCTNFLGLSVLLLLGLCRYRYLEKLYRSLPLKWHPELFTEQGLRDQFGRDVFIGDNLDPKVEKYLNQYLRYLKFHGVDINNDPACRCIVDSEIYLTLTENFSESFEPLVQSSCEDEDADDFAERSKRWRIDGIPQTQEVPHTKPRPAPPLYRYQAGQKLPLYYPKAGTWNF